MFVAAAEDDRYTCDSSLNPRTRCAPHQDTDRGLDGTAASNAVASLRMQTMAAKKSRATHGVALPAFFQLRGRSPGGLAADANSFEVPVGTPACGVAAPRWVAPPWMSLPSGNGKVSGRNNK